MRQFSGELSHASYVDWAVRELYGILRSRNLVACALDVSGDDLRARRDSRFRLEAVEVGEGGGGKTGWGNVQGRVLKGSMD